MKKYKCKICGKEFSTKQQLGGHATVHTRKTDNIQVKECEYCGKEFVVHNWNSDRRWCSKKCWGNSRKLEKLISNKRWNKSLKFLTDYKESHPVCEICGNKELDIHKSNNLSMNLDHDHETNEFRGILCFQCNSKIEWYLRNKQKLEEYLSRPKP